MRKYKFFAKFDCVVSVDGREIELEENKFLDVSLNENDIVKIFPIATQKHCYSLAYAKKVRDFDFIDFKDFYLTPIKERLICKNNIELASSEFDKCTYKLYSYPHIFSVNYDGDNFKFEIFDKLNQYKLEQNYLLAKSEEKTHFCVFHKQTKKFSYFTATNIEVNKNKIICTDILNDIAKHCEKKEYSFDNSDCALLSQELYYVQREPKMTFIKELIPLAFLQAVKCNDFGLARKYLSVSLKSKLTDAHLKAFFQDIQEIVPVEDKFAVIDKQGKAEVYTFEFYENLISNIITL